MAFLLRSIATRRATTSAWSSFVDCEPNFSISLSVAGMQLTRPSTSVAFFLVRDMLTALASSFDHPPTTCSRAYMNILRRRLSAFRRHTSARKISEFLSPACPIKPKAWRIQNTHDGSSHFRSIPHARTSSSNAARTIGSCMFAGEIDFRIPKVTDTLA